MMRVPLFDSTIQYATFRNEVRREFDEIADAQQFILGKKVDEFEAALATYCGANHAIGVSSGTDALIVILMALGIGPGDAVITTPYTFFATAGGIARVGATPIFIDIDPATYNLSPQKLRDFLHEKCRTDAQGNLRAPGGEKIRAIVPVHLFGLAAAMNEIMEVARRFELPVIEDAAQALGTDYPGGTGTMRAGAMGEFGYFSFYPAKNLGAFGDAGAIVCRDKAMDEKIRAVRNHGMTERYFHSLIGGNFRIDALQAAILNIKLPYLNRWCAARRENAGYYREQFARCELLKIYELPVEPYAASGALNHHTYNQFVIRVPRRDELAAHFSKNEIGCAIYYPVPLHLQECFASLGYREGDFPEAERAARETIALPIFPEITREQIRAVVESIAAFYKS